MVSLFAPRAYKLRNDFHKKAPDSHEAFALYIVVNCLELLIHVFAHCFSRRTYGTNRIFESHLVAT